MAVVSSPRSQLKAAVSVLALAALAGCTGLTPPQQNKLNVYGADTPQSQQARVDRLVRYCERIHDGGDHAMAIGLCTRAHELDPTNPLPLAMLAESFKAIGNDDAAMQTYKQIVELHPRNADAHYLLGKLYVDQGNEPQAMESFMAGLQADPTSVRLHNVVGVLADKRGRHDTAQYHYNEALAIEPRNLSVKSNLGLSLALSGQREEAIAVLNDVVKHPEASEISHHNLAVAYAMPEEAPEDTAVAPSVAPVESVEAQRLPQDSAPLVEETVVASEAGEPPLPDAPERLQKAAAKSEEAPRVPRFDRPVSEEVAVRVPYTVQDDRAPVSLLDGAMAATEGAVWDVEEVDDAAWENASMADDMQIWSKALTRVRTDGGR